MSSRLITEFYENAFGEIRKEIDSEEPEYIVSQNSDNLTKYYVGEYILPTLEKDGSREIKWKPISVRGGISVSLEYPVIPKDKLDDVMEMQPSSFTSFGAGDEFEFDENNSVIIDKNPTSKDIVERKLQILENNIAQRNKNIEEGNSNLINRVKNYIENKQREIEKEITDIEQVINKIPVKLVRKESDNVPYVNFLQTREEIKPLVKPNAKRRDELVLDKEALNSVIHILRNMGLQFEKTPRVYSKLEEEDLRDILLGTLSAIFRADVTGETFNREGKTDIRVKISDRDILISECKFWSGQENYSKSIDQLFSYLTLRENYAIIIMFSRNRGFTDVVDKAKESVKNQSTFIQGSLKEVESSYFISNHRFPSDDGKTLEIHHIMFDLFLDN